MKKLVKWFSIFAVIGTAIGLAVAYFCKNSSDIPEENDPAETEMMTLILMPIFNLHPTENMYL